MEEKFGISSLLKGIVKDFWSLLVILGFVFIITAVMGVVYVLTALFVEFFVFVGVIFSIILFFSVIGIGMLLNNVFFKKIPEDGGGLWKYFVHHEVPLGDYSTGYRLNFILSRLSFLAIMVVLFVVVLFITGIVNIIPNICCVLAPISIPLIIITITLPAIAWISFTYAFDPYEPEPRGMVILAIVWGMISTFPSLFLNTANSFWMEDLGLSTAVFSAPIVEEFFKSLGFFLIFTQIRDETDGVIYGSAFGAGFSLLENMIYGGQTVFAVGGIGFIFLIGFRSFFNIMGHMLGPAVIGFLIGWTRRYLSPQIAKRTSGPQSHKLSVSFVLICLIVVGFIFSVLNHGMWNFLVSTENVWLILIALLFGFVQLFMFVGLVILGYFLATGRYNRRLKEFNSRRRKYGKKPVFR
jgi:RsiW-degrading membrane proteinase PrsW (M82 family)